jgi:hypothetical protein
MRARPREINIFNMSLLDILCGALGAFCFMMLVTLPHYVPAGFEALIVKNRAQTERLLQEAEALRARLQDAGAAEELKQLIENLSAQMKQLEGQANKYAHENTQLRAANEKQERRVKQSKPFMVVAAAAELTQDLDVYVEDELVSETSGKRANPPFDPHKSIHSSGWSYDIAGIRVRNRAVTPWVSANTVANTSYKLFVKYAGVVENRIVTEVNSSLHGDFPDTTSIPLPTVTLSPARFWSLIGMINVDANNQLSFQAATDAQRDEVWRAVMKSEPPPNPTPLTVATATPVTLPRTFTSPPASEQEQRERRERYMRQRGVQPPAPSPP